MTLSSRVGRVKVMLLSPMAKAADVGAAADRTPLSSMTLMGMDRSACAVRSRLTMKDTGAPSATGVVPAAMVAPG